jgi:NADH:ubiquinone reductase (H+-translocating)
VLVEASPRVLNTFPESLSASARRQLARLGVEVITERPVRALTRESVTLDDQVIHAGTILWGAGVQAVPLAATLGVPLDRGGRIIVDPDGRIPGHPTAYAIGDIAAAPGKGGRPLPGVAPVAMQAGRAAAANIIRQIAGEPTRPFRYFDKGNVATIGRAAGVADFGWARVSGLLAWLCWLSIHIWYLVDFQNRFVVFVKWAWSYLTYQRGARLITGETAWSRAPLRAGDEPRAVPE